MKFETLDLEPILQKYFGFSEFYPLQKEIIEHIMQGKDAVVLMPTGGGKSLCYQLPALLNGGITIVVSPLIALMKDQVESLKSNGIDAEFINSSLTALETREILHRIEKGEVKLLYVSPERIFSGNFLNYLNSLDVKLFAIDEAHCVSSWGHHFRPEYKKLSILKEEIPEIPVVALTATADKAVRSDIGELLNLKEPKYFISSFDRPNLSMAVLPGRKKWEQIERIIDRHRGQSGIIYCSSRKATEDLATKLQLKGIKANAYHAGMENKERSHVQEDFLQGEIDVICATIAFGMGIDKPNIRFVIHHNMPGNIESYYQEIGRAGRDGMPAETVLFYSYRDVQMQLGFIQEVENEQYKKIQLAKLQRMQEFAEGQVCRRKILLTYFSEFPEKDCGNCDVCKNPPKYFDGSVEAQIVCSAITRLKEKVGISTLIDVLKGTYSEAVKENQYFRIKTFGIGKRITAFSWQMYIQQMLQQGIIELDYKDGYKLKLTPLSKRILFEGEKVGLVTVDTIKNRQITQEKETKKLTVKEKAKLSLFEELRQLRKEIANKKGKPAFTVFSDASLNNMIEKVPSTYYEFLEVEGVGEYKAKKYAADFLRVIANFMAQNKISDTYKTTWTLYNQGLSISEIAKKRKVQETTIYSHLGKLISDGKKIEINEILNEKEIAMMQEAIDSIGFQDQIKPYYDFLEGELDFGKIRVALCFLEKNIEE